MRVVPLVTQRFLWLLINLIKQIWCNIVLILHFNNYYNQVTGSIGQMTEYNKIWLVKTKTKVGFLPMTDRNWQPWPLRILLLTNSESIKLITG